MQAPNPIFMQSGVIASAAPAPGPVTPSVGTITPYSLDTGTDVGSFSFSHTRASGAGVHLQIEYRSNGNPSPTVSSVTYGGVAMTIEAQDKEDGANHIGAFVASMDPGTGPTGANTVAITLSDVAARDAAGFAADITNTAGAYAGVCVTFDDAGATTTTTNITPSNAASLLVGGGGVVDATSSLTKGAAWDLEGSTTESANDSGGVEAVLQSQATGDTSVTAIDFTVGVSKTMRAAGGIEWLPS